MYLDDRPVDPPTPVTDPSSVAASVVGASVVGVAAATSPVPSPVPSSPAYGLPVSGSWAVLLRPPVDLEVVVPAYNEERRLPRTLEALTDRLARLPLRTAVVVVDNGSSDGTAQLVREWSGAPVDVHLIGCSRQGKGAAVRRGVLSSQARWTGFCDADLATGLDVLPQVVQALQAGAPVVIGSRRAVGADLAERQRGLRRVGGAGFRGVARRLVPGVSDTQCGFKFFAGPVARALFGECRSDGFAFDVEVLARAVRAGLPIHEVPVTWWSRPGSTFSVLHDGHRAAQELVQIRGHLRRDRLVTSTAGPTAGRAG